MRLAYIFLNRFFLLQFLPAKDSHSLSLKRILQKIPAAARGRRAGPSGIVLTCVAEDFEQAGGGGFASPDPDVGLCQVAERL